MNIKKTFVLSALALALASSLAIAETDNKAAKFWWPEQLDLRALRQNSAESMGCVYVNATDAELNGRLAGLYTLWDGD